MFKRIVSFLSAVIVMTSSVFAWDAYSFTGVYDVASSAPVLYADSSSDSSVLIDNQIQSWYNRISVNSYTGLIVNQTYDPEPVMPGLDIGPITSNQRLNPYYQLIPYYFYYGAISSDVIEFRSSGDNYWTVEEKPNSDTTYNTISGPYYSDSSNSGGSAVSNFLFIDVSVSGLPSFSTFELDGSFSFFAYVWQLNSAILSQSSSSFVLDLFVDGQQIQTFYADPSGVLDFNHFVYNGTSPVSTLQFRVNFDRPVYTLNTNESVNVYTGFMFYDWSVQLLSIGDLDALHGFTDQAQGDINDHESMESQWTGSMSSNFDALDMDSFTFPSGLLSGFSLITGIFQDLWNGMGDYKILYVFPLFLGIALLLIGRISKFSGGQSSSRSNRGDDDA